MCDVTEDNQAMDAFGLHRLASVPVGLTRREKWAAGC